MSLKQLLKSTKSSESIPSSKKIGKSIDIPDKILLTLDNGESYEG